MFNSPRQNLRRRPPFPSLYPVTKIDVLDLSLVLVFLGLVSPLWSSDLFPSPHKPFYVVGFIVVPSGALSGVSTDLSPRLLSFMRNLPPLWRNLPPSRRDLPLSRRDLPPLWRDHYHLPPCSRRDLPPLSSSSWRQLVKAQPLWHLEPNLFVHLLWHLNMLQHLRFLTKCCRLISCRSSSILLWRISWLLSMVLTFYLIVFKLCISIVFVFRTFDKWSLWQRVLDSFGCCNRKSVSNIIIVWQIKRNDEKVYYYFLKRLSMTKM